MYVCESTLSFKEYDVRFWKQSNLHIHIDSPNNYVLLARINRNMTLLYLKIFKFDSFYLLIATSS